ncbi:putative beta-1,3-galactosyltransferase 14 [Wolffia australiana]
MATPRRIFHSRQSSSPLSLIARLRRIYSSPLFNLFCLGFGLLGIIFGFVGTPNSQISAIKCRNSEPLSVRFTAEEGGRVDDGKILIQRPKILGFVGIQTGFDSARRRLSLRKTWFPSDRDGLLRLENATGLVFRFVIGRTDDSYKMAALRKEVSEFDDFMLINIEERYSNLPYKTLAFFKAAYHLYDAKFYVKADDDIYLRPDRLSLLLARERIHAQSYIGCMKKGPVFRDPGQKWYEPLSGLLGSEYFLHAYGPLYALSADVVASLVTLRNNSFRMFSNEDVTIGSWMLAMNVDHEHSHELCETECTPSFISVWDIPKCSGLCNPEERLLQLHQMTACRS